MGQTDARVKGGLTFKLDKSTTGVIHYQISTALLDETICAMTNHSPCSGIEGKNLFRMLYS